MEKGIKIVFKIEIESLFGNDGILSHAKMEHLSMVCANLQNSGIKVMLVSSGAIALGARRLGLDTPPSGITAKQAVSAIGQAELIKSYQDCFENFDQIVAQVLLTKDVIENPLRNKNARNTLDRLLEKGIIPIINENDSVSTQDIILNDNYPLVLIVASLTDADAIVINTLNGERYGLMIRDSAAVAEVGIDELLNLDEVIKKHNQLEDRDITGFPDQFQPAENK
jgi:glutamate 5-kinase